LIVYLFICQPDICIKTAGSRRISDFRFFSMPLFYQHTINEATKLGIWRIDEPESFFLSNVPLKKDVSHPHKRLQHLAGRYLLPTLFPDFPLEEIVIADTRKPFLENEKYHFSISHCGDYAAAIVSSSNRVGVDIELVTPKIGRISHKFLSPAEYGLAYRSANLGNGIQIDHSSMQTLLWSAKEAMYKWYGAGLVDFKKHMRLLGTLSQDDSGWIQMPFGFNKNGTVNLNVKGRWDGDITLAWVMS
jgi:4'-phosphopantetheinyl transferase EntD